MKVLTIMMGLSLLAFVGYLFVSGNTALAIIVLIGSVIFLPLVIKALNGGLYLGSVSHDTTNSSSGGTSGGVGPSGGDGC